MCPNLTFSPFCSLGPNHSHLPQPLPNSGALSVLLHILRTWLSALTPPLCPSSHQSLGSIYSTSTVAKPLSSLLSLPGVQGPSEAFNWPPCLLATHSCSIAQGLSKECLRTGVHGLYAPAHWIDPKFLNIDPKAIGELSPALLSSPISLPPSHTHSPCRLLSHRTTHLPLRL